MTPSVWIFIEAVLLGLAAGSFLNVVIHRLPIMVRRRQAIECAHVQGWRPPVFERLDLMHPPSCCPSCSARLAAWQNIPVASWLLLRGRCAGCKSRISARYPAVELLSAFIAILMAAHFGPTWHALAAAIFAWSLLALAAIDVDENLLPNQVVIPLLWAGLIVNCCFSGFTSASSSVAAAAGSYVALASAHAIYRALRKREGLGHGDLKVIAAIGAWTGVSLLLGILLMATTLLGGSALVVHIMSRRGVEMQQPLTPFLAAAAVTGVVFSRELTAMLYTATVRAL